MKALREAKAIYALLTDKDAAQVGYDDLVIAFAALVEAVEAAPVVLVGESINYGALLAGTGIKNGQRVRVVAVGEEGDE